MRDTTGSPERVRWLHLARSGSQSQRSILCILPAHGASHIINFHTRSVSLSLFLCLTVECLARFTANGLRFLGPCYWYHHTYPTDLILLWRLVGWITAPGTTNGEGNLNSGKYHNQGAYCHRSIFLVGQFKRCVLRDKGRSAPIRIIRMGTAKVLSQYIPQAALIVIQCQS